MSKYIKCVNNEGYPKLLRLKKIYKVLNEDKTQYSIQVSRRLITNFYKHLFIEVDPSEFYKQTARTIINNNTSEIEYEATKKQWRPWTDLYKDTPAPNLPAGTVIASKECSHEWKNYLGFTETYDYCIKCNAKKD